MLLQRAPTRALTDYITLGRSGLRVSPLSLGTMTFGEEVKWGSDTQASQTVLAHYLDRGGNFIDTANVYTSGHSEKIIGDYLAGAGRRDRVVLATKFFGNQHYRDPNGGGASRKSMMQAVQQSLRRLQTDYIDLYWVHFWDLHTPIEETMRALDDLVRAGSVRYIGLSDTPAWKISQAQTSALLRGWTPLSAIQLEYSLIERSHEIDTLAMCNELGLAVAAWSPLKSGPLSGKHSRESAARGEADRGIFLSGSFNERNFAIVDALIDVSRQHGSTPAQVALAWLLTRPADVIPIIGARTLEQLNQNLAAVEVVLSPEQLQQLDSVSKPAGSFFEYVAGLAPTIMHGGMSVNGLAAVEFPRGPKPDAKLY